MDKKPYSNVRIWTVTVRKLRLVAAISGEPGTAVLDRLITAELARVKKANAEELK